MENIGKEVTLLFDIKRISNVREYYVDSVGRLLFLAWGHKTNPLFHVLLAFWRMMKSYKAA